MTPDAAALQACREALGQERAMAKEAIAGLNAQLVSVAAERRQEMQRADVAERDRDIARASELMERTLARLLAARLSCALQQARDSEAVAARWKDALRAGHKVAGKWYAKARDLKQYIASSEDGDAHRALMDMLACVNGDGGHRASAVGVVQAAGEAMAKYYDLLRRVDELEFALKGRQ